jgi:glycine cleavage system H protein
MADASYPEDCLYHPDHDWARIDDGVATFGITWFAQDALGEVVFFDPPEVGSSVTANDPYGDGWMVKVKLSDPSQIDSLMDRDAYVGSLS